MYLLTITVSRCLWLMRRHGANPAVYGSRVLIDAYSRSVLGFALLYEDPCIESIQQALQHAIWPKSGLRELGIEGEWPCYGIPLQLSLDNAWCHHSHSLEDLAREISMNGRLTASISYFASHTKPIWRTHRALLWDTFCTDQGATGRCYLVRPPERHSKCSAASLLALPGHIQIYPRRDRYVPEYQAQ